MTVRYRFFTLLCCAVCCLLLAGCPHHLVQQVERMLPPKDYKPVYLTSNIPLDTLLERMRRQGMQPMTGKNNMPVVIDMDEVGGTPAVRNLPVSQDSSVSQGSSAPQDPPVSQKPSAPQELSASRSAAASRPASPLLLHIRAVDDSRYPDEIVMRAFVYDTSGRFVMGLAPPYFRGDGSYRDYWYSLVDSCGGRAVAIDSFTVTEVRESDREPHAIAFVLDHSPSMGRERALRLQEAVRRTLGYVAPGDHIAVIKFTKDIKVEVPLSGDSTVYRRSFAVDGLEGYGGGTAMYDAARAGIEQVAAAPASCKRAIILFTDGDDNSSDATFEEVYAYARKHNVAVYAIAYGLVDEQPLQELVSYCGGRLYRIYSSKEFPYVFADIYRSLKNYYRIRYRPPQCAGVHTATAGLVFRELGFALRARGRYDRSVFTPFDTVGSVVFANIEFEYGKAAVREESMPFIREVATAMLSRPTMTIEIRGHTDDVGSDDFNLRLSQERAQSVANELIHLGVEPKRLSVVGYGESRPLVSNTSPENAKKNRRTEFVILSK